VVVDNGGSDGSSEYVRERWPEVEVVRLERNVGVAAAFNRGIEAADGELVGILNDDLELDPEYFAVLVRCLQDHPEAGSAVGKIRNYWRRDEIDAVGDTFAWNSAASHRGFGEPDRGQFDAGAWVFAPGAGATLTWKRVFDDVGGYDEDFFAYLEDVDWGLRAQLAGYRTRYEPRALAYHMGGTTTGKQQTRYTALLRRNLVSLVIKDYPARALVRHLPRVLRFHAGFVVNGLRDGTAWLHMKSMVAALGQLPKTLRKRRSVQRSRRVSLAYLDSVIDAP